MCKIAHFARQMGGQKFHKFNAVLISGPYDLDLKKGVDFDLKNSVYLDLNSSAAGNLDLKPEMCQECT